jgi:mannosyl-3-phosphoglycerate phosphatase
MNTIHWLIATDLDGTLLDDSYPYHDAGRAVDEVQAQFPLRVALASSKTLTEMLDIAQHSTVAPFLIFENGGGVAWPSGALRQPGERRISGYEVSVLGGDIGDVYRALNQLKNVSGFEFQCFSDLSDQQICEITRLAPEAVEPARQRLTSEPILWHGDNDALTVFRERLADYGLKVERGGRFLHVGSGSNKARALKHLRRKICYEHGLRPRVLACGDAPNDREMIVAADLALLFPDDDGKYLYTPDDKHTHAAQAGPRHWLQGVQHIVANAGI